MRSAGILLHISSLPSPYGIGTLGKEARDFVDFLKAAGQKWWQVLPVGPTSYGDSPYQSFSAYAGNPYFIDLTELIEEGLLSKTEVESFDWGKEKDKVDYGLLYKNRIRLFKMAYERFGEKIEPDYPDYPDFLEKNKEWLEPYALFMALKEENDGADWRHFPKALKFREKEALLAAKETYADEIGMWSMLQYLFFMQWKSLKAYANKQGIRLIGDIPIYVASDSADVWTDPKEFYLDEELDMIAVAGCPPDAFSDDGQLWGNPLYRWDVMEKNDFLWWKKRLRAVTGLYDLIRIDHFRGFEAYYSIPAGDKSAKGGKWNKGPGMKLFDALKKEFEDLPLIAEDLGYLTPEVHELLAKTKFPGMKVLQFAFGEGGGNMYLPHHYTKNCVCYPGTHDNDTLLGWYKTAPEQAKKEAEEYCGLNEKEGIGWGLCRTAWQSVADLVIVSMQDLLELGGEARMNEPSTLGKNWKWRMTEEPPKSLAKKIAQKTLLYGRIDKKEMNAVRVIEIKKSVTDSNDRDADALRKELKEKGIFLLNLMSSPGSGKTTTLRETIRRMKDEIKIGVMEADIDSDVDAKAIAETGVKAIQLHTGGMCHLDAGMTRQGLDELVDGDVEFAVLENVGNLVCPAEFDTGAVKNAMILSVPEGDDKPLKYPLMFSVCDVVLVNKIDVLPYFDFDLEKCRANVALRNPKAKVIPICAKTGEGMDDWIAWLKEEIRIWKG